MMRNRVIVFGLAAFIVVVIALFVSFTLLPPAPPAPTPTWPRGIDLPDKLPRIPY